MANALIDRLRQRDESFTEVTLNQPDIPLDDLTEALECSNTVKSFQMTERFFGLGCPGYVAPAAKQVQSLMRQVGCLEVVEQLVIRGTLQKLTIPGSILGLAISKSLKQLNVKAGITFDNTHDVSVMVKQLSNHSGLEELSIRNFVIHCQDFGDERPLLDPLIEAISTISKLQALDLTCLMSHRQWRRCFFLPNSIERLFSLPNLTRLNLSKLGLEDQHFILLAELLWHNTSLVEVVVNDNHHNAAGLQAMIQMLESNTTLTTLKLYNHNRISIESYNLLQNVLENTNRTLTTLEINCQWNQRTAIAFYLLLNRVTRAQIHNPKATNSQRIGVLADMKDNLSALFFVLRNNPSLCDASKYRQNMLSPSPRPGGRPKLKLTSVQQRDVLARTSCLLTTKTSDACSLSMRLDEIPMISLDERIPQLVSLPDLSSVQGLQANSSLSTIQVFSTDISPREVGSFEHQNRHELSPSKKATEQVRPTHRQSSFSSGDGLGLGFSKNSENDRVEMDTGKRSETPGYTQSGEGNLKTNFCSEGDNTHVPRYSFQPIQSYDEAVEEEEFTRTQQPIATKQKSPEFGVRKWSSSLKSGGCTSRKTDQLERADTSTGVPVTQKQQVSSWISLQDAKQSRLNPPSDNLPVTIPDESTRSRRDQAPRSESLHQLQKNGKIQDVRCSAKPEVSRMERRDTDMSGRREFAIEKQELRVDNDNNHESTCSLEHLNNQSGKHVQREFEPRHCHSHEEILQCRVEEQRHNLQKNHQILHRKAIKGYQECDRESTSSVFLVSVVGDNTSETFPTEGRICPRLLKQRKKVRRIRRLVRQRDVETSDSGASESQEQRLRMEREKRRSMRRHKAARKFRVRNSNDEEIAEDTFPGQHQWRHLVQQRQVHPAQHLSPVLDKGPPTRTSSGRVLSMRQKFERTYHSVHSKS